MSKQIHSLLTRCSDDRIGASLAMFNLVSDHGNIEESFGIGFGKTWYQSCHFASSPEEHCAFEKALKLWNAANDENVHVSRYNPRSLAMLNLVAPYTHELCDEVEGVLAGYGAMPVSKTIDLHSKALESIQHPRAIQINMSMRVPLNLDLNELEAEICRAAGFRHENFATIAEMNEAHRYGFPTYSLGHASDLRPQVDHGSASSNVRIEAGGMGVAAVETHPSAGIDTPLHKAVSQIGKVIKTAGMQIGDRWHQFSFFLSSRTVYCSQKVQQLNRSLMIDSARIAPIDAMQVGSARIRCHDRRHLLSDVCRTFGDVGVQILMLNAGATHESMFETWVHFCVPETAKMVELDRALGLLGSTRIEILPASASLGLILSIC